MSDLTGWCVVADKRIITSGLTWEGATQMTSDAFNTGLYKNVHVVSAHSAQFYIAMEKSNELET